MDRSLGTVRCKRCLCDETITIFDPDGICDLCHIHDRFEREYPTGVTGMRKLVKIAHKIKGAGRGCKYDVIVGVSGGCDSSYLLYITRRLGLRPLAVHFDNGWNTTTAIENMKKMTTALKVELFVHRAGSEYNDLCRAFLRAGVPDIDIPNDIAMMSVLYSVAEAERVKYIFVGHSFRTEGITPLNWTYMDGKYIQSVHKKYGTVSLSRYPNLLMADFLRWVVVGGIRRVRPLYYLDYQKELVKEFLAREFGWERYGGSHLENLYTRFVLNYFQLKRYGRDMRMVTLSALVRSGQMTRADAIEELETPLPMSQGLIDMVRACLGLSVGELTRIIYCPRRTHKDFVTYRSFFRRTRWFWWLMYKFNRVPESFYIKYAKGIE